MNERAARPSEVLADAVDMESVKRVLVVKLRHHGDVLLSSPVFSVLKNHAPHAMIDALVYDDTAQMLAGHPAIRQVHVVGRDWRRRSTLSKLMHEWRLYAGLRAGRYDLLVHLTDHPRGAWLARALGLHAAVAPANRRRGWKTSFSHRYPVAGQRHQVELNLDALRRIGIQVGVNERALVMVPGPQADARASALLSEHQLSTKGFIHLHPTSRWRFKCWPAPHVAEIVDALDARGLRVVLTSAPDAAERAFVADVLATARSRPVDLSGQLTLKELAALTAHARLFIGVDSAPMHIAAAMRTPALALFGPSGETEWAPWNVPHRIVAANEFPCRPCGYDGCGGGKVSECLTMLPASRVLAAIDELLSTT
jgi:heptosyltransferase-3